MSNPMKYGPAKRIMLRFPGLRDFGARFFTYLPQSVSPLAYDLSRRTLFRDNLNRLPVFRAAMETVAKSDCPGDYLEFGVARGTSLITAYKQSKRFKALDDMQFHAFDSFEGLPDSEGFFVKGEMSYDEQTFRRFASKAGIDLSRVTTTPGFYDKTLTQRRAEELGISADRAHLVHIDCDLYVSTVPVLKFLTPVLGTGSVIIFDDWFNFDHEDVPGDHGEQRAFDEWSERGKMRELHVTPMWNASFVKET